MGVSMTGGGQLPREVEVTNSEGSPVPVTGALEATILGAVTVENVGLDKIDVPLSTRTKPTDQQHAILDGGTLTTVTNVVHIDDNGSSLTVDGAVSATQSGPWDVEVNNNVDDEFLTDTKTIGLSSVQLSASSVPIEFGVLIKSNVANNGIVYVSNTNPATSTNGFELDNGESVNIPIDNLNKVFLIATKANQIISYSAL